MFNIYYDDVLVNTIAAPDLETVEKFYPAPYVIEEIEEVVKEEIDLRPELVVTNITCSDPHAVIQSGDVTCLEGSTITATAELRAPDGSIIPLTATFRMPLVARDKRERVIIASLVNGVATIIMTINESGVWVISEDTLNSGLPPEMKMKFQRHEIYVAQS